MIILQYQQLHIGIMIVISNKGWSPFQGNFIDSEVEMLVVQAFGKVNVKEIFSCDFILFSLLSVIQHR